MELSRELVEQVAALARLRLSEQQLDCLTGELAQIVHLAEQLDELDTENIEPLTGTHDALGDAPTELLAGTAADVPHPSLPRSEALANAPKQDGECYLVPPVL